MNIHQQLSCIYTLVKFFIKKINEMHELIYLLKLYYLIE